MYQLTKSEIVKTLRSVISEDDRIIVIHSNVFSFGQMDNITEEIMAAVEEVLKPHQTLLMPTFTFSFCKSGWYHHRETPSETGVLTEYFRQLPSVQRTSCPINSFAIKGPEAEYFLSFGKSKTCWGKDSIYQALYNQNALIVGLGERLALKSSIFHYAEEDKGVPYRYFKTFSGKADFGEGPEDVSKGMYVRRLDVPVVYDYSPAINELKKTSRIREIPLGTSFVEAIKAVDAIETLKKMIEKDPLVALSSRREYEEMTSRKSVAFIGSSNLDLMSRSFSDTYNQFTKNACRIVPIPFNQYQQHIIQEESPLRVSNPDYLIFLERAEDILGKFLKNPIQHDLKDLDKDIAESVSYYVNLIKQAREVLSGIFIVANFETMTPSPLGNIDGTSPSGHRKIIELANKYLKERLKIVSDVHLLDFQALTISSCGSIKLIRFGD